MAVLDRVQDLYTYQMPLAPGAHKAICLPREKEVTHILNLFRQGRWVALFGRSGVGRTTLLNLIAERMGSKRWNVLPLIVNAAKVANSEKSNVFNAFVSECKVAFERLHDDVAIRNQAVGKFIAGHRTNDDSEQSFQQFVVTTAELASSHTLVLMLDNVDLIGRECRYFIFNTLGTLYRLRVGKSWKIHFLLTGQDDEGDWLGPVYGGDLYAGDSVTSPFRQYLAKAYLRPFGFEEMYDLAVRGQERFGIKIKPAAVSTIEKWTDGVPRQVQKLLYFTFQHAISEDLAAISAEDVANVAWEEYPEELLGSTPIRQIITRLSDFVSELSEAGVEDRLAKIEIDLRHLKESGSTPRRVDNPQRSSGVYRQIDQLYEELAELNERRLEQPLESSIQTNIRDRFARLRKLQHDEAEVIETRFTESLLMPIDAGDQLLRELEEIRKNANTARPDETSDTADGPTTPT
ncbi:MAG: hypothetical protein HYV60_06665 [Planctomycetia bacterium]|nr:hypothetical protein [Planctomycetia bacterium]